MDLRGVQAGEAGIGASVARAGLSVLAGGWAVAQWLKPIAYDLGLRRRVTLPVPVISVGNLVVGGTGKTPCVAWLCGRLRDAGHRPGVLARGYGPEVTPADAGGPLDDEGTVLRALLGPDVPQVQQGDRVAGGRRLLDCHPDTDVLVLDDGFQHWRLARALDIVLIDASCPFGYGHYLPRGRLREPPGALGRAGAVLITRADGASASDLESIERTIRLYTDAPVARAAVRPTTRLEGRRVFVACGIGAPQGFVITVERAGGQIVGQRCFPDHRAFLESGSLDDVLSEARTLGAECVVTTRKDAVKLPALPGDVIVLDIETEILAGEDELRAAVSRALA